MIHQTNKHTKIITMTLLNKTIPFNLTNGNEGRGGSWHNSAKLRRDVEIKLRMLGLTRKPFDVPVTVHVTRVLGKGQRLWDSSSISRGSYKEIEDALVVCGWFHDDSPKYITETRFYQDDSQREKGPNIYISIESSHNRIKK